MYMNDGNKTKISLSNKSVFITGVAGFIGSNLAKRLLSTVEDVKVVGLDNMNHYYDVRLKEARLNELEQFDNFSFVKGNLADKAVIESIFEQYKPEIVVNLGAQAGVRYSITNPDAYVEANLIGFYNILEACRHSYDEGHTPVKHLVYASSSSVYDYSYFLDFANEGKKKIAYGSSIGDCWKDTDKSKIKNLLEQYDAVSVREEDTSCYIREAFGLPCKWVADPTMLLPTPFWESCTTPVKEKEYVIVYFPSDHLIETAKEYCKLHNKKLIVLRVMLPWKRKGSKILYSPNEWLSYLKDADAVFTNSYHGLLFSLYFNKPVWTDNQSNRVQALLKRLNLECCNLKNDTTCSNVIDYRQCNKLIQSFREDSLEYLKSVL